MNVLSARDGYRRWSSRYAAENPVSALDEDVVCAFGIPTAGRRLLDAGCGTGRRLRAASASFGVGIDVTPEMLAESTGIEPIAVADVRCLPFASTSFDVVWCRLVVGHLRELTDVYAELARVCRRGGDVVVTDFHPDAVAAGHRRTFRNADGVHEIEHHVHDRAAHAAAAATARLTLQQQAAGAVGPTVRHFYASANRLEAYEAQTGLPLVLAFAYRHDA